MPLVAREVDPRDISWELDAPVFRVYLWRRPTPDHAWQCWEWELSGGDVEEVLAWADDPPAPCDVAEVWVVVPDGAVRGQGKGMIRLRGYNPNESRRD
jgi:hypothetical protein